jgi:hypothetical protein
MSKTIAAWVGSVRMGLGLALVGSTMFEAGCTVQSNDASKYREPIPQASDAALALPGSQASATGGQSASSVHIQGGAAGGGTTGYATYYAFTRDIADAVDFTTAVILGALVAVTDGPPTTIDSSHAVWGPSNGGNALDPVTWKLVVTEVADREFDYEVDGRPHLSTSDADWKAILTGHGWGKTHPNHRTGWFQVDNDAFRALDPQRGRDQGTVKVTFDARSYPITIAAHVVQPATGSWFDVTVTHQQDGSGTVGVIALGDVDTPKDGVNENVALDSRWNQTGAGRADVKLSGGDFKSLAVLASECWSSAFTRTYYTDSVGYQPTSGDPSSCVFPQATP